VNVGWVKVEGRSQQGKKPMRGKRGGAGREQAKDTMVWKTSQKITGENTLFILRR